MTTTVIVDDSHPSIIYGDGWTEGGVTSSRSNEYNGTIHTAASNGLQLSYQFTGSRISAYGTLAAPLVNGVPTSTYIIDNLTTTTFTGANLATIPDLQSHLLFYQSPPLPQGPHTLTVTVSNITGGSPKYYLDFFTVETSSPDSTAHIIVDDSDSGIKYAGNWSDSHAFNEYLTTDHKASNLGDANATYVFNGTSIEIYGSIATSNDPVTEIDFYVDSNPAIRYTAPQAGDIWRHVLLFSQSSLPPGQHTLLIAGQKSSEWWLDYLIYSSGHAATSSSPSISASNGQSSSSAPPVGPIVGGVVGGVFLLSCIGILLFLRRRARIRQESTVAHPSILPDTSRHPHGSTSKSRIVESAPNVSENGTARPAIPSQAVEPLQEVDGGVRLAFEDEIGDPMPTVLPPVYAQY